MSLTGCVAKAGEYLNAEDRSALFARANELRAKYVSEGLGKVEAADRAAREAVLEVRDSVRSLNQSPSGRELSPESRDFIIALASIARDAFRAEPNSKAILAKPLMDGGTGGAQGFSDLAVSQPGGAQEDGLVGTPALGAMLAEMRSAVLNDAQVLDAIVGSVPVDVVNDLFGSKAAAKVALHNEAMLQDSPAFDAEMPVSGGLGDATNPVGLLVREAASRAAEVGRVALRSGLEPAEAYSALSAKQGYGFSQGESPGKAPRAQISFPTNLTAGASVISLLSGADWSSVLHESGHFFLEVQADLAIRIQQQISSGASVSDLERGIVSDMNALLEWFGVTGYDSASGPTGGELNQGAKQTDTEAFRRWFGDSKVVDATGDPLVVYHGTEKAGFAAFDPSKTGENTGRDLEGFYFTESKRNAQTYSGSRADAKVSQEEGFDARYDGEPGNYAVFLSIKNPYEIDYGGRNFDGASEDDQEGDPWFHMDRVVARAKAAGHDGVIATNITDEGRHGQGYGWGRNTYVAFRPEQIKSATGNRGTFDPNDQNILNQGGPDVEAGPSPLGRTPLETWSMMSLAEKTPHHEKFAQGFEKFAMEGKAPSLTLQGAFHKFRSWLIQIYKKLTGLDVKLTDDVRDVMSRMIASDQAIEEMEAVRSLGALFKTADKAGMTLEQFNAYQESARAATDGAIAELQARSLKDMKWLSGARDRALKARQAEVEELRREARIEARASVYSEPVYQAWQFLTGKKPDAPDSDADIAYAQDVRMRKEKRAEFEEQAAKEEREKLWAASDEAKAGVKGLAKGQFMARNKRQIGINVEQRMLEWDKANPEPKTPESQEPDMPPGTEVGKLNTEALRELYGNGEKAKWRRLSSLRMTSDKGAHPEAVAERFGFDSADALVSALSEATPPREVIEARTDELMMEKYGDINSPEAFARAADEAVHNELRARVLASELDALQKASAPRADAGTDKQGKRKTADLLSKAAKAYADEIVSKLRVRDIRPAQYTGAEARSGRMAEKAFAKGDTQEAAKHKRNQLLNHHAAKRAMEAQDEVRRVVKYLRKFEGETKAIDPGYREQIDSLLERFDFKPVTLKAIDQRKSLAAWMAEQEALGIVPDIPEAVLSEANRKSYKDMPLEELSDLVDSVRQIEHLGRLKNKLSLAQDKREFSALASEMIEAIQKTGTLKDIPLEDVGVVYQAEQKLKAFAAMHRKTSSLIRQMDGSDDGPIYRALGRSMNERGTMEDLMLEKATVELQRIYAPILALPGGVTGLRSKLHIKELNASLTRGGRLAFALNWGNEQNRQRMLSQYSEAQVRAVLKTLSPVELEFVNNVWRYIDTFWPQVAEKEERVTGVAPKKVEAMPFVVEASDGTEVSMRGGYYPLKYDSRRSDKASQQEKAEEAKQMMAGFFSRATTRRGHTKKRTETVNRPVSLNLNVITQHVTQVVHDLAWHEWIIDANKVLGDKEVAGAIRDYYGPAILDTLRENVKGIAGGDTVAQTAVDRILLGMRNNISRSTMGLSINTAFLQPFGLTQSMVRIGPKYVLQGAAKWAGDAARFESATKDIYAKSDFMRLRAKTFSRELREIAGSVGGKSKAMQVVDGGLFMMMQKMQLVADIPTWLGQYQKSIDQGMDEAAAVASADRAVIEAQGAGHSKDLAEVQRKHPLLTQFYSYFSVTLNLVAEQTSQTDFKNPRAVAGWLGDMALLIVIPAILPALAMSFLKGDDEEDLAQKMARAQLGYLLGMVVLGREFSGPVSGYDYTGPPAGRIVTDTYRLGQQIAQGEVDEAAVVALIRLMGDAFGLPVTQVIRSYKGWKAWDEGEAGPQAILFGPPSP